MARGTAISPRMEITSDTSTTVSTRSRLSSGQKGMVFGVLERESLPNREARAYHDRTMAHALLHTLGGAGITVALCSASAADGGPSGDRTLRFATDVRPILSEHCFPCHGFDENKREAGLRFDQREGAFNLLPSGGHAIVPGEPENSLLVARTSATDSSERMPPAEFNRPLNADQVATLEQWIKEGAKWEEHWSFAPVADDAPPATTESLKPIDAFIRARLAQSSLEPSPEADPITLLRRVTYDLTGLPPTSEEVEAFL
ncbi:MAG TPA: DUF1549 domain-containing protein, partial [Planctomycetes bacterium]|nr:DUF1549 domain-containing protein [Planctomycetota bacterium]